MGLEPAAASSLVRAGDICCHEDAQDSHGKDAGIAGSAAAKEAMDLIHALRDDLEEGEDDAADDGADEMED